MPSPEPHPPYKILGLWSDGAMIAEDAEGGSWTLGTDMNRLGYKPPHECELQPTREVSDRFYTVRTIVDIRDVITKLFGEDGRSGEVGDMGQAVTAETLFPLDALRAIARYVALKKDQRDFSDAVERGPNDFFRESGQAQMARLETNLRRIADQLQGEVIPALRDSLRTTLTP